MRIIGLDIGEIRTGVAVSDRDMLVATPITVLQTKRLLADPRPLRDLVEEEDVRLAVVGLPLTMAGEEGPQARRVRDVAGRLGSALGIELTFVDERLSSAEAAKAMTAAGKDSRSQRGMLDMVAASLVLQSYLDAARRGGADA